MGGLIGPIDLARAARCPPVHLNRNGLKFGHLAMTAGQELAYRIGRSAWGPPGSDGMPDSRLPLKRAPQPDDTTHETTSRHHDITNSV